MDTILVVDDEKNYLLVLETLFTKEGYQVLTADSAYSALDKLKEADVDLLITDMRMPGLDGLGLLKAVKEQSPETPVILMTAYATVDKAVEAMKRGALDYLMKPFENERMLLTVAKGLQMGRLVRQNRMLLGQMEAGYGQIVGRSSAMREVFRLVDKVAPARATVLVTGESGTGKELVARAIHRRSPREGKAFISVNCAALPDTLLESELFGHEKGAFTGAVSARKGRFELADGGSLFLDEIGHTSPSLQVRLLRVVQEMTFERLGGSRTIKVDVRLITASNRDLKAEVEAGRIIEDLYYRLNVVHIHLPPLRERRDDIPLLAGHFLDKYTRELGRSGLEFAPAALEALATYPWPGNVRELENVVERAVVLASGDRIRPEDLPVEVRSGGEGFDLAGFLPEGTTLPQALTALEKHLLLSALKKADYVQTKAAEFLGISKSHLHYKLKAHDLNPNPPAGQGSKI